METKEIIDTVATQVTEAAAQWPEYGLADYFIHSGRGSMCVITLFLIAVLVSAWKAPAWVRDFGFGAVIAALCWASVSLCQMFMVMEQYGALTANIYGGGFWRIMVPIIYSLLIYLLSILISIFQKPRI